MAGKTGPEDGAEAVPVDPATRPEGRFPDEPPAFEAEDARTEDSLSPGEPSWPEDPTALQAEALDAAPEASGSALIGWASSDSVEVPAADAPDAGVRPGRAGPPWEWEATPSSSDDRPTFDESPTVPDLESVSPSPAASLEEPGRPSSEPLLATSAPLGVAPAPLPPPARRRGGVGALLLGGMIAAALGFGAAWVARDRLGPAELALAPEFEERLAALEARPVVDGTEVQTLADRLAEAEARLESLEAAPASPTDPAPAADLGPLREEIAAGLADAQARAADLEERLAALEARPAATDPGPAVRAPAASVGTGESPTAGPDPRLGDVETSVAAAQDALSGVEAALAALEDRVNLNNEALATLDRQVIENASALQAFEQRLSEAEAAGTAAAEEARAAAASLAEAQTRATEAETQARTGTALAALGAALDGGEPFEASLSELQAAGAAVPEALAQAAAEGVPTLASLRDEFPEASRAGLAAAREAGLVDDGGVLGFLRGQLSVRSTAPREGEDPDAVLSRAEAALAEGRLETALGEVATLPEPVRAAMADWIARAQARAGAQAALATLREAEPPAAPAN